MKRALLVGIDSYRHFQALGGCVNDVMAVAPLLARNQDDSPNYDCQIMTSDSSHVTRDTLLAALDRLFGPGADNALFYFAGHGAELKSDVAVVTQDGTLQTPGIAFSEVLSRVQASHVREVVIILDCCFSGGAGGVPQLGGESAALRPGVTILSASRADQTSEETPAGRGMFSTYLEAALDGGAADVVGKVTVAGLYAYLSESFGAWEQRPTLKANVDHAQYLRECAPAVPLADLRQLPALFPTPEALLQLDPSFEPTEEPRHEENERTFGLLQRCRAAKLVEPVGAEHLYFAAMSSTGCRLTALGRHYRHMADRGRL